MVDPGCFEALDAVAEGKAQIGHGTSYYWKDKHDMAAKKAQKA
jgi:TRAP-type mannitol/chloroaromatic compound transport system substrate-binding protein